MVEQSWPGRETETAKAEQCIIQQAAVKETLLVAGCHLPSLFLGCWAALEARSAERVIFDNGACLLMKHPFWFLTPRDAASHGGNRGELDAAVSGKVRLN
jgi:hypothetical protein